MTALDLARQQFRDGDNLFRAGVKIRVHHTLRADPALDMDSVFIKSVASERRGDPLP